MRLFVAIQFSPAVRSALLEAVETLRRQGAAGLPARRICI